MKLHQVEKEFPIDDDAQEFINSIFNRKTTRLPGKEQYAQFIAFNKHCNAPVDLKKVLPTVIFRAVYNKHCYPILSHEFIETLIHVITTMKFSSIVDVGSGPGWLSWWLQTYGVTNIHAADSMMWPNFNDYLDFVIKDDGCNYIQDNDCNLVILSWPENRENFALRVWESLKPGQWLLYIGEKKGGWTADDAFYEAIADHKVKDIWGLQNSFLSFWGIYDRPVLYKK